MLLRYFFTALVTCIFLSACQNEGNSGTKDIASTEDATPAETTPSSDAKPAVKSLRQAAKEQREDTRLKVRAAQQEQEKKEGLGKGEMKVERQTKKDLLTNNQVVSKNESTKERIFKNLRSGKLKTGNSGNPSPSKDLMQAVRSLADIDLKIEKVGKKQIAGYEWYGKAVPIDDFYAYTSSDGTWGGPFSQEKGTEAEDFLLQDVQVFEAVFKSTKVTKGLRPDVKVTEIQFADKTSAEASIPKIEAISKAIFSNPKHINTFWQDEEKIYIIETRAASFKDVYDKAHKVFYHTVTSSK